MFKLKKEATHVPNVLSKKILQSIQETKQMQCSSALREAVYAENKKLEIWYGKYLVNRQCYITSQYNEGSIYFSIIGFYIFAVSCSICLLHWMAGNV